MSVTKEQVMEQLKTVMDPELGKDLVTLNMIKNVALCDGMARITVELTTPACPLKDKISFDVKKAVTQLDGISMCEVEFTAQVKPSPQQQAQDSNPLPNVKHVIAVGAGKGGVGKSTISVNLAVGLARAGAKVGLLDGDIYGPSLPTMLGLDDLETHTAGGNMISPFEVHGIKSMTIGKLVDPDKPLIWRGPMAHGAFNQLATQTQWGELDYLVIDMPPGTGDVPLTLAQLLPLTGAVVVCTPQKVAQDDARRAVRMFQQLQVPILGIVENMSYFIGNDGVEYDIFGKGGAQAMAHQMEVPYLGGVPINMRLRANCDNGNPTANFDDDAQLGAELETVVKNLAGQVSIQVHQTQAQTPTISIS